MKSRHKCVVMLSVFFLSLKNDLNINKNKIINKKFELTNSYICYWFLQVVLVTRW